MHSFRVAYVVDGDRIVLGDSRQVHHLKDVLRLGAGDFATVFDAGGQECLCEIVAVSQEGVTLQVRSRRMVAAPRAKLAIACALPKKGLDEIVDKLAQLGVDTIIPMRTARVVVRLGETAAAGRLERWRRLAESAAAQSQRFDLAELRPVTDIADVLSQSAGYDLKLIPTLSGNRQMLPDVLSHGRPANALVLIGPEGDFTDEEVQAALQAGFIPISLGAQVLRVDTAAIAVAAYLRIAGVI